MKNYNDTLTKAKYKNYITISTDHFIEKDNFQQLEEYSMNWNLGSHFYEQGFSNLYDSESMLDEAITHIQKQTKLKEEFILSQQKEEIEARIVQSCAYAYESDYLSKMLVYTRDSINESIENEVEQLEINNNYQIAYYSKEDNTLHDEFKYNTTEIRVYLKQSCIKQAFSNYYSSNIEEWSIDEVISEFDYVFTPKEVNYEHFDYYGTVADYDDWLSYFVDYEEISSYLNDYTKHKHDILVQA